MTSPSHSLRAVRSDADRAAIARLRYQVYVEEMGRKQPFANPDAKTIHEPLDEGALLLGAFTPEGAAIGTVRVNAVASSLIPFPELYGWEERERRYPGQVCFASKLVVAAPRRRTLVATRLFRAATSAGLRRGWRFAFLDANDHLVGLYARLGFVGRGRRQHPLYGEVTIMEWDMHDLAHLRATRSPLLSECSRFLEGTLPTIAA